MSFKTIMFAVISLLIGYYIGGGETAYGYMIIFAICNLFLGLSFSADVNSWDSDTLEVTSGDIFIITFLGIVGIIGYFIINIFFNGN